MGIAAMDDDGPIALLRQPQMAVEVILLQFDRGVVPVAVQAGFAQGDHAGMIQQTTDRVPIAGPRFRAGIRVNADRRKEIRIGFRQMDRRPAGGCGRAQGDDAFHADSGCAFHDRRTVGVELLVVEMAVGVDHGAGSRERVNCRRERYLPYFLLLAPSCALTARRRHAF